MSTLEIHSHGARRARTRSLIQIAGLIGKSGLLETFQIELGLDLQKDMAMKEPIAALFKGFLVLNEMVQSDGVSLHLWAIEGMEELHSLKTKII